MGLQSTGAISLDDLHVEVGGTSGTTCSLNDADIRALINVGDSAGQSIQQYYGKSSETSLPTGGSTINGQVQLQEITASTYISSGGTLRIPSNMWVWSNSRTTAALTIDIPCTIINDGKIIGKGGQGGSGLRVKNLAHPTTSAYNSGYNTTNLGTGSDGGMAIKINSGVCNVTITNSSGAYIGGGGGGGGSSSVEPNNTFSGGGGGAGGGDGGKANFNDNEGRGYPNYTTNGPSHSTFAAYGDSGGQATGIGNNNPPLMGFGGKLNEKGVRFYRPNSSTFSYLFSYRAEAGGCGIRSSGEDQTSVGGDGGGRILPGVRYNPHYQTLTGGTINTANGSYGGAANEAGENGGSGGHSGEPGGGGGWGAAGGRGYRGAFTGVQCQGGDAGKAIDDSGVSYTLSNSGIIYGGT